MLLAPRWPGLPNLGLEYLGNSIENTLVSDVLNDCMKKCLEIPVSLLGCTSLICIIVCGGCGEPAADTPAADTANTSRPQIVASKLPIAHERSSVRRKKDNPQTREVSLWDTNSAPTAAPKPTIAAQSSSSSSTPSVTGSPTVAQQLLARLSKIDLSSGSISQVQASEVNQLLQQLREQGAAGVSAIREFLQRNEDLNFDALAGGESVEFSSLRLGLIDALHQIGGPEATAVAAEVLQTTTDPLEIALLSLTLEQQSPGQYRQIEITAAQNALAQALGGEQKGDLSALFETFQAIGDTNVVPVLKQAVTRWNYYATLALAGLPDGAGIPALIQLAQDPSISSLGSGDFALRPLAQVAVQYPDAADALLNIARQNQVPDSAWPTVAASLAGTYIQYGNQLFGSTAPTLSWSPTEINQRITLINQLLATTSSPAARQSLQSALTSLSSRLPK
jgi:hypothetical protein